MVTFTPMVVDRSIAADPEHVRLIRSGVLILTLETVTRLGAPTHVEFVTAHGIDHVFGVRAARKGPRRHVNLLSKYSGPGAGARALSCHAVLHRLGRAFPRAVTVVPHTWEDGPTLLVDVSSLPMAGEG